MDLPSNPMVIVGVHIIGGPLDLNDLETTLAERFLSISRLRQRAELRGRDYWWVDDPHFEQSRHIRRVRLPGKGGKAELESYIAELASEPMDKSRPLWQMRIVEDFEGGAAVVTRFHHAIADGMALVGVMLSVTDQSGDNTGSARHFAKGGKRKSLALPGLETLTRGAELSAEVWNEALSLASNPGKALRTGAGVAGELAYLLLMPQDTPTRFKGALSGNKRVAWTDPLPLPEVHAVSRALGCSINDMLLASVAGALGAYLRDKGDPTEDVEIRTLVPVDMRGKERAGELGNRFGIVAVELPVGIESPLERLAEVHRRMKELKQSLEPPVTLGLLMGLGYAPKLVQDRLFNLLLSRATAVMTNVPGPRHPLYFGGHEIKQIMFWVPSSGNIGMGVSILSFNDMVQFGLITDAALVPGPEEIVAHFRPKFEQLLYYVLMRPWDGDSEHAEAAYEHSHISPHPRPKPHAKKPPMPVVPETRRRGRGNGAAKLPRH
jgi:diacylglycerol O-acyltransferase